MNLVDVDNVLEGLASTCYYLNWDRNRYRFGLSPNLNQILVTRRGAVQAKDIDERINKQTQKLFNQGTKQIDRRLGRTQQRRAQPAGVDARGAGARPPGGREERPIS